MNKEDLSKEKKHLTYNNGFRDLTIKNAFDCVELFFYGEIITDEIDYNAIKNKIVNAIALDKNIIIRIHSYNGSILKGMEIYDVLKTSKNEVTVYIEGIVSDYTLPIALAGTKVFMMENSFYNLESVKMVAWGCKAVIQSTIDLLVSAEEKLFNIFKTRISTDSEMLIGNYLAKPYASFIDSEISKKLNLCDEVIAPTKKRVFNKEETAISMLIDADNSQMIEVKVSEYLKGKASWTFKDWQEKDVKGLIDLAIAYPVSFHKLFTASYPTNYILNKNQKLINNKSKMEIPKERKEWTVKDWQEKDQSGLMSLTDEQRETILIKEMENKNTPIENKIVSRREWTSEDWENKDPQGWQQFYTEYPEEAIKLKNK